VVKQRNIVVNADVGPEPASRTAVNVQAEGLRVNPLGRISDHPPQGILHHGIERPVLPRGQCLGLREKLGIEPERGSGHDASVAVDI